MLQELDKTRPQWDDPVGIVHQLVVLLVLHGFGRYFAVLPMDKGCFPMAAFKGNATRRVLQLNQKSYTALYNIPPKAVASPYSPRADMEHLPTDFPSQTLGQCA